MISIIERFLHIVSKGNVKGFRKSFARERNYVITLYGNGIKETTTVESNDDD